MSKRFINTNIWEKPFFEDIDYKKKLLVFYLITRCNNIGILNISLKMITFQIGFEVTESDILSLPIDIEKISDNCYWLSKFCHHQYGELKESCPPHRRYINDLKECGLYERVVKGYCKGIKTLEEKEEEKEKEEDAGKIKKIIEFLNSELGTSYKPTTDKTRKLINARLKEGFTLKDFNDVILKKKEDWTGTEYEKYLRPETIFGNKFESYLQESKLCADKPPQRKSGQKQDIIPTEHLWFFDHYGYEGYVDFCREQGFEPELNEKRQWIA